MDNNHPFWAISRLDENIQLVELTFRVYRPTLQIGLSSSTLINLHGLVHGSNPTRKYIHILKEIISLMRLLVS